MTSMTHASHEHNQNLGNVIGSRPSVRMSKLYRRYESGSAMKSILGNSHLDWNIEKNEGAYYGKTFDCYADDVANYYCDENVHKKTSKINLKRRNPIKSTKIKNEKKKEQKSMLSLQGEKEEKNSNIGLGYVDTVSALQEVCENRGPLQGVKKMRKRKKNRSSTSRDWKTTQQDYGAWALRK